MVTRDTLHYRKLTDKPKDEEKEELENGEKHAEIAVNWHEIALGNKKLLPVFEEEASKINAKPAVEGGKPLGSEGEFKLLKGGKPRSSEKNAKTILSLKFKIFSLNKLFWFFTLSLSPFQHLKK